jgi:hypothetical protein
VYSRCFVRGIAQSATVVFGLMAFSAQAATVQLEIATEQRVSLTAQQEWAKRLGTAGIANVRLRSAHDGEEPVIHSEGSGPTAVHRVLGILTPDEVLVLPGRRFRVTEVRQLIQWLDDLARKGPDERQAPKTAFGMELEQFKKLHDELSKPVGFSTAGVSRQEVIRQIAQQSSLPIAGVPDAKSAGDDDKVVEELSSVSCGTALAYVLRPLGMCLVPQPANGRTTLAIVGSGSKEIWPIGWPLDKTQDKTLPTMFEFLNTNVQGVPVTKVVDAVRKRLEVPALWDYSAMARYGIEPEQAIVSVPQGRMSYSLLLRKALFQAKLKSEIRIDEAGKPLLWITTQKPL